MRLIDADALIDDLIFPTEQFKKGFIDTLYDAPAIKVEQVRHGRWEYKHFSSEPHCSLCLAEYPVETNYCPNCGAKMDGGAN